MTRRTSAFIVVDRTLLVSAAFLLSLQTAKLSPCGTLRSHGWGHTRAEGPVWVTCLLFGPAREDGVTSILRIFALRTGKESETWSWPQRTRLCPETGHWPTSLESVLSPCFDSFATLLLLLPECELCCPNPKGPPVPRCLRLGRRSRAAQTRRVSTPTGTCALEK